MPSARLPVFEKFIGDLRAVWSAETDEARRMDKAKPLVEAFVKDPDLKAHSAQWPSTEGRKNLLLYVDPAYDFVVNAVVRVPGRADGCLRIDSTIDRSLLNKLAVLSFSTASMTFAISLSLIGWPLR